MSVPESPRSDEDGADGAGEVYKTMDLALRIGELLLSSGAGAADVGAQMDNVGRACGLRGFAADVTFTELTMTHQSRPDEPALIQMRQVRQRVTDYADLTVVDRLVRDLVSGHVKRDEAATRLNRIVSTGHAYPRWSVTLALGIMGGAIALMLGGNWLVLLIAWFAAGCIDVVQRQMARRRWPTFYQQAAGGAFATLLAAGVAAGGEHVGPNRVITASIFLMLAGVSFLGAMQDALTGFPLTSAARLLDAVLATIGVLGGVSGGLTLAGLLGVGLGSVDPGSIVFAAMPLAVLGGAGAAAAFAFASYAPPRSLVPTAAIGAGATALYLFVRGQGVSVPWSSAVAAVLIGVVSFSVAGRCRVPPLVLVTPAIVPLLPGLSIYRALALFASGNPGGLLALANAVAITVALGSGVIFGQYVAQPLKREARRLEGRLAGPRLVGPMTARSERRRRRDTA